MMFLILTYIASVMVGVVVGATSMVLLVVGRDEHGE